MNKLIVVSFLVFFSSFGFAKDHRVEMLNSNDGKSMVFSPMSLKIKVGDTVIFTPTIKGHTSQSVFVPEKANVWKGETSKEVRVTLNKEGIYFYKCQNHGIMGMIGMIQVGKPRNLSEAKKFYKIFKKEIVMNKDRLDKYFNKIKN